MLENYAKRCFSFLLALVMVFSMVPVQAFATETETEPHAHEEETIAESLTAEVDQDTASVVETEPVAETEAAVETEPVVETEAAVETESAAETEPAVETEPVVETETAAETEPASETEPVVETEPTVETVPEETVVEELITDEVEAAVSVTVTYNSALGSVTASGAAVASGATASGSMTAAANSGAAFLGWVSTADHKILSTSATYTPGVNVTAAFASASSSAWFRVDSTYLVNDLNKAAEVGTKIVLAADGTLSAGDYTIPKGDTLLIPFDAAETCYTTAPVAVHDNRIQPYAYRTLTMADGATLTVNGAMSLSAQHHAVQSSLPWGGSPNGPISFVRMNGSSNITVNGALYAYGFITGSGSVTVNSGASVYENFQITDFRGGNMTSIMGTNGKGVFPLSQYYVQNIEVPMTLYAGAKEYSYTSIFMSSQIFGSSVDFIAPSNSMFNMKTGYVVKRYDGSTDRLILDAYGDLEISPISMPVGDTTLNSENFVLPINSNISVRVNEGTITIRQNAALLPGAEIYIAEGSECILYSNAYVYDKDEWGDYCGSSNEQLSPLGYVPGRGNVTRTAASLVDAKIIIEGTVNALSGVLYTTKGGAAITGVEGAVAGIANKADTVTRQVIQAEQPENSQYVEIPVTSAKLQNGDGTYVATGETGNYKYVKSRWHTVTCGGKLTTTVTTKATCTATGEQTITCGCGISYVEEIPAAGHKEKTIAGVAATCTTTGLTEGKYCSVCNETLVEREVIAKGDHVWGTVTVITNPTCTTEGTNRGTCSKCYETENYTIDKLPHTEETEIWLNKDATCTEDGNYDEVVWCSSCNQDLSEKNVIIPATGHSYEETTVPAKCTTQGYTTYTCTNDGCSDSYKGNYVDATGHKWVDGEITQQPNCTSTGVRKTTCETCGETGTKTLDALGHTEVVDEAVAPTCTTSGLTEGKHCSVCKAVIVAQETVKASDHAWNDGEIATDPTCIHSGVKTYTCQRCGETKTETVEADGIHTVEVIPAVEATCTTTGWTAGEKCSVCQDILKPQMQTAMAAHTPGTAVEEDRVEPSCTEAGSYDEVVYCSVCKTHEISRTTKTVAAKGHTPGDDATCTEAQICTVCKETVIEALGHDYDDGDVTTAPNCTEKGVMTFTCSRGDDSYTEEIKALGHTSETSAAKEPTCTEVGLTAASTCTVCHETIEAGVEIPALGHDYVGVETTAPSCSAEGLMTYTCSRCEDSYTEAIDKVAHQEVTLAAVAATCTVDGKTEGKQCTVCGTVTVEQTVIAALRHKETTVAGQPASCEIDGLTDGKKCTVCGEVTVAQTVIKAPGHVEDDGVITTQPSCSSTGVKTYSCQTCGATLRTEAVAKLAHTEVADKAVAATCTTTGLTEGKHCSVCGEILVPQEEVAVLSHTWDAGEITTTPTCTGTGVRTYTCTACITATKTETVAANGHNEDEIVKGYAATCTEKGLTDGAKCSACGETRVEQQEIPANGHTEGEAKVENKKEPTCTREGSYELVTYCTVCGEQRFRETKSEPALGHTVRALAAVAPTCSENGLTEGEECIVCGRMLKVQDEVPSLGHTPVTDAAVAPTCTETGLMAGVHCSVCNEVLTAQEKIPAIGHKDEIDEAVAATCTKTGLTEGKHCSECDEVLVAQEEVPMLDHKWGTGRITKEPTCTEDGVRTFTCPECLQSKDETEKALDHDIKNVDAKVPTYIGVGWEAYEYCGREGCGYTTYVEIPMLEKPILDTYEEFLENLTILEQITAEYVEDHPGKDPLALMIKYIRTGVDRYNDGSWNIMAGYEDAGFAKYVQDYEDNHNNQAASVDELTCVTILKDIEFFHLPNGNLVDFGHMFGTMDITYHNSGSQNHADVAGWAGDLVDLLDVSSRHGTSGTLNEMISTVASTYLASTNLDEEDIFSLKDMYGDMDGFYLIEMATAQDYTTGMFSEIVKNYFTASLTDEARAEFFLQNRLDGVTSRTGLREKVYSEYTGNSMVPTLEATREFSNTGVLSDLRKACCYAFADYLCKLAGDYTEVTSNDYYNVFETKTSTLAPGITQEINKATTADNKQIVYYIATADINSEYVDVYANYKTRDPYNEETGTYDWGMSRVRDQANAAEALYGDPNSSEYITNFNVIAAINGAGYNMSTGEPGGLLVMGGVEYKAPNDNGFFGILKDGTAVIGTTAEYHAMKDQVMEGIAGFGSTLVHEGKISISATSDYYTSRASRTAVGITRTGKVVFMVLDGRQEPVSCGGSMEEIAQIMLEAGCVEAINLDGGGSTTYVAQQAGEEEISLVSSPSDGFERSVATSLMMVSTAPSSTEFDHAVLSSEVDYLTVGAQVQVTAAGVSAMGNGVEVPAGAVWTVADESYGTIDTNGVFTAKKNGTVQIQLKLDGATVGTKNLNIVTPNRIYFSKDNITMLYGDTVTLPIVALYNNKTVKMVESDLTYELSNEKAGKAEGFAFTAAETNLSSVKVTAKLKADESITATVTISMFERGEGYFDFDTEATGGDRQLAWNRTVSNATTKDEQTYTVIDSEKPMTTSYRFAIDMTQIPIPERLSDLVYMLPGADVEGANNAWSFLCQLAERISPMTEVKAVIHVDPNFDVDYSETKLVNDYFELNGKEFDPETNTLTLTLNFIDQTKAIEVDTANAMCILSGIKLTPKSNAAWDAKDRLMPVHKGEISYKVYMRTSALYTFSQNPENQKKYGLYDYVNPNDDYDKGGYFGDIYKTFSDSYTLVNGLNGWVPEGNGYAYYEDGEKYTGIQEVDGYYYDFGDNGICVGQSKYTGLFQVDGKNRYAKNGELVSGWVSVDGKKYCFDTNGNGYDGKVKIDEVEIEFVDGLMVGGYTGFVKKSDGNTYYYENGEMTYGWLQTKDAWYHFNTETGVMTTGTHVIPDDEARAKGAYYDFADDGRALRGYPNDFGYYYWAGQPIRSDWVKNGYDPDPDAWYYTGGYGHYATSPTESFKLTLDGKEYTAVKIPVDHDGDGNADVVYTFDNTNGKLLRGDVVVNDDGSLSYYWAGEPRNNGWFTIGGVTYYAYENGKLATGSNVIDGTAYMFTSNGALVTEGVILTAVLTNNEREMNIKVTNTEKVYKMRFAVWHEGGKQTDTLQWIDAEKGANGEWTAKIPMCTFNRAGTYFIHAYATIDGKESLLVDSEVTAATVADHTYSNDQDEICDICNEKTRSVKIATTPMYRLFNPNSSEHFYTGSINERDTLVAVGWNYEGIAWNAPISSGKPVYRVFSPNSSDHHYTMSWEEVQNLEAAGWKYEGVAWNSASEDNVPQQRLYNPNADCGSHHYTSSQEELNHLVSLGWIHEGIGWFGIA